ncbi:TPA: nitroreductase, partial [Bacillus cereus]|nr:nitroreductase [Bacillus cereus]
IDEEVRKEWDVPENWKLIAQMPFGKPVVHAGEKEFQPLEDRVKIYK